MQENKVTAGENWVIEAGLPMSNQKNGFEVVLKKFCQTKMETQSCKSSAFMASVMHIRLSSLLKYC